MLNIDTSLDTRTNFGVGKQTKQLLVFKHVLIIYVLAIKLRLWRMLKVCVNNTWCLLLYSDHERSLSLSLAVKSVAFKSCFCAETEHSPTWRYKLVTEIKDWASAEQHCTSMQAGLAIMASNAERHAIVDYLATVDS